MHVTFVPKNFKVTPLHRTSLHCTSLHCTSKQNHFTYTTSVHSTSLHSFTLNSHLNSFACNYILNPLSKEFSLRGKDASKLTGNWFQLIMILFTKEYLPESVLCVEHSCRTVHSWSDIIDTFGDSDTGLRVNSKVSV